ncbi:MAG: thioesterase [Prevotellaceae bacterium]|nr:thioesterase [Prevotellaceae bacterium]
MLSKVGRYEFLSEPFHCDFSKRLFMGHLGNHMLNAADFHSTHRGFGMTYLNPIHKTWVLSRLAIEMEEMPQEYAKFCVETWVESAMKYFTNRNFRVVDAENEDHVYGYGRSIWAMIDTETRQPQNIMEIRNGEINEYIETEKPCPIGKLSRVQMSNDASLVATIDTHYSDVDVNGHINSVKYIEHVLDLFDIEKYRSCRIKRFDIAYVAESHFGDKLNFYREETGDNEYCIRITRKSPDEAEEVEVCRSKVKFVKE